MGQEWNDQLGRYGVWGGDLRGTSTREARAVAVELETLGFGTLWFPEHDGREVFVNLALLLAATQRIAGGTSIANVFARDPLAMVAAANTLGEAFPGRFALGIGVSHRALVEGVRGQNYERPLARMTQYLEAMDDAAYAPHRARFPTLLAALGPRMLELAAERADGVIPYLATVEHTARARAVMPTKLVCPVQAVVLGADRTETRRIARIHHVARYLELPNYTSNLARLGFDDDDRRNGGSDRMIDALVAHGPDDVVIARIDEQFSAGADHVCVQVIHPSRNEPPISAWREVASAIGLDAQAVQPR